MIGQILNVSVMGVRQMEKYVLFEWRMMWDDGLTIRLNKTGS
jgi:hypothetical protein